MKATCDICPRACEIEEGGLGFCRARTNRNGAVVCENYARVTSIALDPIEKKPLARFHPGSMILSVGRFGCNMDCPFCQNESCSRADEQSIEWRVLPPNELASLAEKLKPRGNIGAAFTYNEPMIGFEYVRDASKAVRGRGMKSAVVTNGAVSLDALDEVLPYIDAVNIDLKGFTQSFYDWIGGDLKTTKAAIEMAAEDGVHVEVTTLVIPGKNDSAAEMAAEAEWLAGISAELPLHLSRYFPRYQVDIPMTPVETLQQLRRVAEARLRFVHLGNI